MDAASSDSSSSWLDSQHPPPPHKRFRRFEVVERSENARHAHFPPPGFRIPTQSDSVSSKPTLSSDHDPESPSVLPETPQTGSADASATTTSIDSFYSEEIDRQLDEFVCEHIRMVDEGHSCVNCADKARTVFSLDAAKSCESVSEIIFDKTQEEVDSFDEDF